MLAGISSRTLAEWMAFYRLEPFGPPREDQRAGTIAATIFNMQRGKARPLGPDAFFPPNSAQERKANMADRIKAALGGRARRRRKRKS